VKYLRIILLSVITPAAWAQSSEVLQFIQNKNQWSEEIDFQAKVPGGMMAISPKGFSIYLIDQEKLEQDHLNSHRTFNESDGQPVQEPTDGHYFQINFLGANLQAKAKPTKKLTGYYNYFIGSDSCKWAVDVPAFEEIIYPEIYSGIDLRISSLGKNLKYDFVVAPGADPNQIQIEYCGVDAIEGNNGDLSIQTTLGFLTEKKPVSFQEENNERKIVNSEYALADRVITFNFPNGYDPCQDLVIDPLLIFSTYSGSTADNWGSTATPGEHGTLYSSGITFYLNVGEFFPATPGAFQTTYGGVYDIAIIKYDSAGTKFLYATFLGGAGNDSPQSLVVDKISGDLIVLGITGSSNYPVSATALDLDYNGGDNVQNGVFHTNNGWDIVVTRLLSTGNEIVGSTYLGGSNNDGLGYPKGSGGLLVTNYGDEMRGDVITDEEGNIFISSVTSSFNFPATAGFGTTYSGGGSDGVVVKLTPNLSSIVWANFIGGSGFDAAYSIKFDNDKNIIVAGGTTSGNFPVTPGTYQASLGGGVDGWIARIAANGNTILNSTFTGTTAYDQVYFIDLNAAGEIFCFGQTAGSMPITTGVYKNPGTGQFLQKFNQNLSGLIFSTVFGAKSGSSIIPNISPTAFLVNECDNIFMSGWGGEVNSTHGYWLSSTTNMAITDDAFQKKTSGSDFYFIVLNGDATELVYATFLGGTQSKTHVDGGTSRFDKFGIVYHAVCAGCPARSDFPTTPGAWSNKNLSQNCNNAAFKFDLASLRAHFQTNTVNFDMPNFDGACFPDSVLFQNLSIGGEFYEWNFGDGTVITKTKKDTVSIVHQYQQEGIYQVKLKAIDDNTCSKVDSVTKTINYFKDIIEVGNGADLCQGTSYQLTASGGISYNWISDDGKTSTQQSPTVQPEDSTIYYVTVVDSDGCSKKDTVHINVIQYVDLKWEYDFITDCISRPYLRIRNLTETSGDETIFFDLGDGTISDEQEFEHHYARDSLYKVKLIGMREFCGNEESVDVPIYTLFAPNVFTPEGSPGFNDKFQVGFGNGDKTPADVGIKLSLTVVDRWGKTVFHSTDYQNDWDASNVGGGIYYIELKLGGLASCRSWLHVLK